MGTSGVSPLMQPINRHGSHEHCLSPARPLHCRSRLPAAVFLQPSSYRSWCLVLGVLLAFGSTAPAGACMFTPWGRGWCERGRLRTRDGIVPPPHAAPQYHSVCGIPPRRSNGPSSPEEYFPPRYAQREIPQRCTKVQHITGGPATCFQSVSRRAAGEYTLPLGVVEIHPSQLLSK